MQWMCVHSVYSICSGCVFCIVYAVGVCMYVQWNSSNLCVSVCLSVCPSVTALAASASAYTCSQRYSGVCLRLFLDKYVWNFEKTFRSRVMA